MDADRFTLGVRLSKVLRRRRFFYADDIRVTACTATFETCRPGDLYVATVEADRDGHDYVHDAISRGATAIVAERLLPVDVPQCLVPDAKAAYGKLCHHLAGNPTRKLQVVGVAGQYGKTATQMLMASVIEAADLRPAVFGSLGHSDGFDAYPATGAEPDAARYAHWLATAVANGCSHAVAALPASELAQHRFAGMAVDTALITGLETSSHRRSERASTH